MDLRGNELIDQLTDAVIRLDAVVHQPEDVGDHGAGGAVAASIPSEEIDDATRNPIERQIERR